MLEEEDMVVMGTVDTMEGEKHIKAGGDARVTFAII